MLVSRINCSSEFYWFATVNTNCIASPPLDEECLATGGQGYSTPERKNGAVRATVHGRKEYVHSRPGGRGSRERGREKKREGGIERGRERESPDSSESIVESIRSACKTIAQPSPVAWGRCCGT